MIETLLRLRRAVLADLGLFFLADVLAIISMDTGVPLTFFPFHFLLVPAPMESPCALIVQCAIPQNTSFQQCD